MFVSLSGGGEDLEKTSVGISSLTDTWLLLRDVELNGERNRIKQADLVFVLHQTLHDGRDNS